MYTPAAGDIGSTLRAQAMYDDVEGEDKTAQQDSANRVRDEPADNTDPAFPDQNPSTLAIETAQEREVAENTPAGRNIGARVAATDPGDVLTYSIPIAGDAESFDINRATGQLTTKAALDHETKEDVQCNGNGNRPIRAHGYGYVGGYHHGDRRERGSNGNAELPR